jgi:hypothetical protein
MMIENLQLVWDEMDDAVKEDYGSFQSFASSCLRSHRDFLLSKTDYRMVSDSPWDTTAWLTYRQVLRDLPADPNWPNVEFPDSPEVN